MPPHLADIAPETLSPALLEAAERAQLGIMITERIADAVKTVFANPVACEMFGFEVEALRDLNIIALAVPEDRDSMLRASADLRAGKTMRMPLEARFPHPSGQVRELEYSSALVQTAQKALVVTFLRDVTLRKQAERKAAAVDAEFRRYMERAPDGVLISRAGTVLWANSQAAQQLGHASGEELEGAFLPSMLDPGEAKELGLRLRRVMETGEPAPPFEYNVRRKDGTLTRAEGSSVRVQWEGEPAVFSVVRDINDRARVLAQLAQTDRLAALGMLAAGVAHEINSPMSATLFAVEGLERLSARIDAPLAGEVRAVLAELRHSAQQVTRIVKELRTFSRGGDDSVGPVDLRAVVLAAERLAGPSVRDIARLEIALDGAPRALGNAERLEQVLVNLLINAVHAMPPGRPTAENQIRVSYQALPERVALLVRDNGAGIPPHLLGRIFEPFFTTKPIGVGTGLGLSICHGIVRQLGGDMAVESTVGAGTTVRVELRAAPL